MKNRGNRWMLSMILLFCQCNGKDGTPGPQGNANVTSTVVTVSSWAPFTSSGVTLERANVSIPAITQDILNNGTVAVFIQTNTVSNGIEWIALPFSFPNLTDNKYITLQYGYLLGEVSLTVVSSNGTDPGNQGSLILKVVSTSGSK